MRSVLSFKGSICALDKAALKAEAHALQCTTAGPSNAIPTSLLGVFSVCGLGPDLVGIRSISLAARKRTAACSNTLNQGPEKIQAARAYDLAPVLALSPIWEKDYHAPSMSRGTSDAFNVVCRLDHDGKLDEASRNKKQKVATGLLSDKLHTQDFCWTNPLSGHQNSGPISRYRVESVLHHMKLVSRASRPGLIVGFVRILCNVLCTAQTFHSEGYEQMCRVGCSNEPDSLPLQRMSSFVQEVVFFWNRLLCFREETMFSLT